MKLHWYWTGTEQGLYCYYNGTALVLPWYYTGSELMMHWPHYCGYSASAVLVERERSESTDQDIASDDPPARDFVPLPRDPPDRPPPEPPRADPAPPGAQPQASPTARPASESPMRRGSHPLKTELTAASCGPLETPGVKAQDRPPRVFPRVRLRLSR